MMTDAVTLAVIAAAAGVPALVIPLFSASLTNRRERKAREAQNARDDLLLARANERADKLELKAQEVARIIQVNNDVATLGVTKLLAGQKQIHTLVNSDRTAGMQDQLDSREIALALLIELVEVKKGLAVPQQPTVETLATIEQMRASVLVLRKAVTDRLKQQEIANEESAKAAVNLHIV